MKNCAPDQQQRLRENGKGESGNVLFLILIAVALFAALSYAATQTGRSNTGARDTVDTIDAAKINQFPTGVHFAVMRMKTGGLDETFMEFNTPENFADLTDNSHGIFHPEGGGIVYQYASPSLMDDGQQGVWYFNGEFEIEEIGIEQSGSFKGNEMIAFLPGVHKNVCVQINDNAELSVDIPVATTDLSGLYTMNMDHNYTVPNTEQLIGQSGGIGLESLHAKPFGCFQNDSGNGEYVYYQVIKNR